MHRPALVLASSSPYRRHLLARLGWPFTWAAPEVDEARLDGESPAALVRRLAESKARALAPRFPQALIVGSDQAAVIEGEVVGKPGSLERAVEQLRRASGKRMEFLTGVCVLDARTAQAEVDCVPYSVHFRNLDAREIRAYLEAERPFDCAGSFKSEGLGIALFDRMEGEDPTALIGLPMIRLTAMLRRLGVDVLSRGAASP